MKTSRPWCEFDTECTVNYWLVKFMVPDGTMYSFDIHDDKPEPLNIAAIQWFIENFTICGFNSLNYDIPMLSLAMAGASPAQLHQANDAIILSGLKAWDFYRVYNVDQPRGLDHVDIMEVAPGVRIGLKAYMGRMHAPTIQDLPFVPGARLNAYEREETDLYCGNDLFGTRMLRETCSERLALRDEIGEEYGVDVRSKSDAQTAEAVIKSKLGFTPEKRIVPHGYTFKYEPPPFIRFCTPLLQEVFATVCAADFVVYDVDQMRSGDMEELYGPDGKKIKTGVKLPAQLKAMKINIGSSSYQFGIGGLHSREQKTQHHTKLGVCTVREDDVRSYYPSIILGLQMFPQQLGPRFLEIYDHEYVDRLRAKTISDDESQPKDVRKKAKNKSNGKKIFLNGVFGKLLSKYSIMFAPELGIRVTITGQLCILMLIEMLECCGISVVSANTDGIVTNCPAGKEWLRDSTIAYWEKITSLEMEQNYIKSIYSRDVNSYIAFGLDGKIKRKGAFSESGVLVPSAGVHPDRDICADAVTEYLRTGKRLEQTIGECRDIKQFLTIRGAKGGGVYYPKSLGPREKVVAEDGAVFLGKTVRWYFSTTSDDHLYTMPKTNEHGKLVRGSKIAGSEKARPCMTLPETFPEDVDYSHYIADAVKMLSTLGVEYAA